MAAFFPNTTFDQGFHPLFRLLDDFDTYKNNGTAPGYGNARQRAEIPSFQPKFDVRETPTSFELHGEFPGLAKEDVTIEFTDPHTILIRGRVERSYTSGTPPAGLVEGEKPTAAITESGEKSPSEEGSADEKVHGHHQPTVEDEGDNSTVGANTPATTTTEVVKPAAAAAPKKRVETGKYWVTERRIGQFSRSFNFPTHVQQDAVAASLKDGILHVSIPKAKKPAAHKVTIN